uniref:Secreted protein n=1 Tax=Hordeum vulgare subsp. vulgare TaxID=112509 RepID=A0A8I6YPE8_HORVV
MGLTAWMLGLGFLGAAAISHSIEVCIDKTAVTHHVANGGCLKEFREAMRKCDPMLDHDDTKRRVACIGATRALRECFGRNPDYFQHQYIKRLDGGLMEDRVRWPAQEDVGKYKWWKHMRRS